MDNNTMKKFLSVALLALFAVLSLLCINEPLKTRRSEYRSSELKQVMTKEEKTTRIDYIDDDGNLRIAADVGYATKLIEYLNNGEIEIYYNDQGERINHYAGYYGVLREYDEDGNNIRITYLDEKNAPTIISLNYAVEEREFNELGQQVSCRYLDVEGKPVLSDESGFGVKYEYNDKGRRVKITYLDENGAPMILALGYSMLIRDYYETDDLNNGRINNEFYFLSDGIPVSLSLGQYGVHKDYYKNGQISQKTYLNADGFPVITNKGYTSVAYTYYADDSVQSTFYYDINGNPYRMSEGQYGTKNENGQLIYLNADGTEQFNIKNYVYNDSAFVIVIAMVLVVLSVITGRKINRLMFIVYLGVIMYFTLMYRETSESKLGILYSYSSFFVKAEARASIIKNIWLFVPLGAILSRLYYRKTILFLPVLLSIAIEAIQYIFGIGLCELDDVISNGLGGAIGYGMSYLNQMLLRRLYQKNIKYLNSQK